MMNPSILKSVSVSLALLTFPFCLVAQETPDRPAMCPIDGKVANPTISTVYEGKTYLFCSEACRSQFSEARVDSLYQRLGGKAAISAAVDRFYVKVLEDQRVNFFFEDVNMKRQHEQQKAFLGAALGGPEPWTGRDLRKAHASLDLDETHFNVIAEHLQATLTELGVEGKLIAEVMTIVGSTKDAVLNRH